MNKDFEHTQPLPRVSPDMESQKTQLLNVGKVRELEPVEIPRRQQQTDNGGYGGAGNMPPGDNTGINGMNSMNSINGRNGMNMNIPGNPPQKDRPGAEGAAGKVPAGQIRCRQGAGQDYRRCRQAEKGS